MQRVCNEIVKMHEQAMNVVYKDIDFKSLEAKTPEPVLTVRFLRPDVAVGIYNQSREDGPAAEAAAAAMVSVLSKHRGKWLIDAVQNTVWGLVPAAPK